MSTAPNDGEVFCHRDIVTHAQRGDADAFRVLYENHSARILSYLRPLVGEFDAEDVASETWVRIHGALASYRNDRGDFRTWTNAIARNQAIDHLRHRRTHTAVPMAPERLPAPVSPHDTEGDAAESLGTERVLALVRGLPRGQAAAVLLCVVIGLDAPTAAQILRKQPSAVRTAAHRGVKTLRKRIDSNGGSGRGHA